MPQLNPLIYSVENCPFDPSTYPNAKKPKGNPKRKAKNTYIDVICAFDIETSTLPGEQAIMYVWQMQLDTFTVMGRTWDEFLTFLTELST